MDMTSAATWGPAGVAIISIAALLTALVAIKKGIETVFGVEIRSKNSRLIYRNRDRLDSLEPDMRAIRTQQKTDSEKINEIRQDVSHMRGMMSKGRSA